MAQFNVTAQEVLGHQHGLQNANYSSWFLLWRYASDHGLLNKDIEAGINVADRIGSGDYRKHISPRQLAAANRVVGHALASLGLDTTGFLP